MNSKLGNQDDANNIIKYGKFFYPAHMHYGNGPVNVCCDFCNKSNLSCSIGFQNSDLCMNCVDKITTKLNRPKEPSTLQGLVSFSTGSITTDMMQKSVRKLPSPSSFNDYDNLTLSEQMKFDSILQNNDTNSMSRFRNNSNMMQDPVSRGKDMTFMMQDSVSRDKDMTFMMQDSVNMSSSFEDNLWL